MTELPVTLGDIGDISRDVVRLVRQHPPVDEQISLLKAWAREDPGELDAQIERLMLRLARWLGSRGNAVAAVEWAVAVTP